MVNLWPFPHLTYIPWLPAASGLWHLSLTHILTALQTWYPGPSPPPAWTACSYVHPSCFPHHHTLLLMHLGVFLGNTPTLPHSQAAAIQLFCWHTVSLSVVSVLQSTCIIQAWWLVGLVAAQCSRGVAVLWTTLHLFTWAMCHFAFYKEGEHSTARYSESIRERPQPIFYHSV